MEQGYIDIKINKTGTEDITKAVPSEGIKAAEPGKTSIQSQAVHTAMITAARQMAMAGIREYGKITGDYATTNMIDTALGIGADIMMLGLGPVGAIAVVGRHTTQLISQNVAISNSNREINFMLSRMGIVSARGSRYGE